MFSVTVLHDERIVIVAEQRPDSTEEDSFQWMSRVLQVALHLPGSPTPAFVPASLNHLLGCGRPSTTVLSCSLTVTPLDQKLHRPGNLSLHAWTVTKQTKVRDRGLRNWLPLFTWRCHK